MESQKIVEIFTHMRELFGGDPVCELNYETDIQLLVAVILSAQCTDKRVNIVTKTLFEKYKTVQDFAAAKPLELEREIYSTGFYRSKARNIIAMAKSVITNHGGVLPKTMEELLHLRGVGRKTASVFLSQFHNIPALAVDTHVIRLSRRLGLSNGKTPEQIERDLKKLFDESNWRDYHHYMVLFGRYYCTAKKPGCPGCKLRSHCLFFDI